MLNFFDGSPDTDFNGLIAYVRSHTPSQMLNDIRASSVDPNILPSIGDMVKMFLPEDGLAHARVAYAEAINQFEKAPHKKAPDISLMFARRNLAACCMPDEPLEAYRVLSSDLTIVPADPVLGIGVAMGLAQEGFLRETHSVVQMIAQIPSEVLMAKLNEAGLGKEVMQQLMTIISQPIRNRKMHDLEWLTSPDSGDIPQKLLEMDLDELQKHGASPDVLRTIKSVVVLQCSNDRKMWFCSFFDVKDPRSLLQGGDTGVFRADFHNRIGRDGEDGQVTVADMIYK